MFPLVTARVMVVALTARLLGLVIVSDTKFALPPEKASGSGPT